MRGTLVNIYVILRGTRLLFKQYKEVATIVQFKALLIENTMMFINEIGCCYATACACSSILTVVCHASDIILTVVCVMLVTVP